MTSGNTISHVVVAMSGGVDSSVAAALLLERGYDVTGMMLRLWAEEPLGDAVYNRCCTPTQMDDARRVADQLGIPFHALDAKQAFRRAVVDFFISQHRQAFTPNPCLECNRHIRFSFLLKNALALDANYLATGHYARIDCTTDGEYRLKRGIDHAKDQSYVLSVLNQEHLPHTLLPIGEYTKTEVRELAKRFGLPTASKHDSQDLCFLGDGDYRHFLAEHAPETMTPGPILLRETGTVIGQHSGLANFTVGQHRGLNVNSIEPLYVLAMDLTHNTLIVGPHNKLGQDRLTANRVNWVSSRIPDNAFRARVKIRYQSKLAPALVEPLSEDRIAVQFDKPQLSIAPGQAAVIYDDEVCLGGGIIEHPAS